MSVVVRGSPARLSYSANGAWPEGLAAEQAALQKAFPVGARVLAFVRCISGPVPNTWGLGTVASVEPPTHAIDSATFGVVFDTELTAVDHRLLATEWPERSELYHRATLLLPDLPSTRELVKVYAALTARITAGERTLEVYRDVMERLRLPAPPATT